MEFTFTIFANVLYPHCGGDLNKADFVTKLIDKIMTKPAALSEKGYLNPMRNKGARIRYRYFDGTRPIPRQVANKISGYINKSRFEYFINEFSEHTRINIAKVLNEKGISSVNQKNVHEKCADIIEKILIDGKYEDVA